MARSVVLIRLSGAQDPTPPPLREAIVQVASRPWLSRVDDPEVQLGLLTGDEAHGAYRAETVKVGCNQSCDLVSLVGYEPTSAPAPG